MQKEIRRVISGLSVRFLSRKCAVRHKIQVPANISISTNIHTKSSAFAQNNLSIGGETEDLSKTGIGFWVDSIRLREHYLVGQNRILDVKLDLPNGVVRMKVIGHRYEQVNIHNTGGKYLIGASIEEMHQSDREIYEEFLQSGKRAFKRRSEAYSAS